MPQSRNNASSTLQDEIVAETKIKPRMHPSFLLGTFTEEHPPTGFSVTIHPNPNPAGSVTTRVSRMDLNDHYKLILHVTNKSARTVGVKVHQL